MFRSLGNYVDFPEYISMAVIYRFILNLEVVIRDREMSSSDQGKSLQGGGGGGGGRGGSFWSKIKIRDMSAKISEYTSEQAVLKDLSWSLYFENCKVLFIYRCIKSPCLTFSFYIFLITVQFYIFSNKTKILNESISKKC